MKISCQSCQAKYTIADEKVLGKVVKIRCKKCGSTIVINGNEAAPKEESETQVFDYTQQGSSEQWTVNVADGDQRTLTVAEIVREYRAGVVNDETYCWKDGMSDWLPVRDIEQLQQALASIGEGRPSLTFEESGAGGFGAPSSGRPASVRPAPEDQFAPSSHRNGNGGGLCGETPAPAAAAARRAGGRGGGGADLFGGVAHAGGEEDVMTSAPTAAAAAAAAADASRDDKLTGQRNENSVLFSLAALTDDKGAGKGPSASDNKTSAQGDGSGLIDIRALSANMGGGGGDAEKNRVDDIMNLSGGGAFGAALAAPILAPPPMEVAAMDQGGGQAKGSNKGLMLGLLGGGAFLAIALVAVAVIVVGAKKTEGGGTATGTGSAATTGTAASTGSGGAIAAADPAGTSTGIAPSTTDTATPPSVGTAGGKAGTAAAGGTAKAPGTSTAAALVAKNDPPPAPGTAAPAPTEKPAAKPASLAEAMATAAGGNKPAPAETAAAGGGGAFDRGAAAAAIGAVNVASCKKPDGPTGSGHAFITFGPDGSVKTVEVDGGPYPGTPVGGCIAGKFRSARVPAFSGSPVRVGKSFTIN
jgi:predicted Zn finger-like uncharacterized protein